MRADFLEGRRAIEADELPPWLQGDTNNYYLHISEFRNRRSRKMVTQLNKGLHRTFPGVAKVLFVVVAIP